MHRNVGFYDLYFLSNNNLREKIAALCRNKNFWDLNFFKHCTKCPIFLKIWYKILSFNCRVIPWISLFWNKLVNVHVCSFDRLLTMSFFPRCVWLPHHCGQCRDCCCCTGLYHLHFAHIILLFFLCASVLAKIICQCKYFWFHFSGEISDHL